MELEVCCPICKTAAAEGKRKGERFVMERVEQQAARWNADALGLASGVLALTVYAACALLIALWPAEVLVLLKLFFHGLNLEPLYQPSVSVAGAFVGGAVTFAASALLGWIFAGLYNRLAARG